MDENVRFESAPGFSHFRDVMKRLVAVSKAELDAELLALKKDGGQAALDAGAHSAVKTIRSRRTDSK